MSDQGRDDQGRFQAEDWNGRLRREAGFGPPPEPGAEAPAAPTPEAGPPAGFDGGQHGSLTGAGPPRKPEDMNDLLRRAMAELYGRE